MEQAPNTSVFDAADPASVTLSVASVDALLDTNASLPARGLHTTSVEFSSTSKPPFCEPTSAALVLPPTTKNSRQHAINTRTNKRGHTALMQFAISGDICRVRALISVGVDVNVVDEVGVSAVAYAAVCGQGGVVQVLLDAKAAPVVVSEGIGALITRVCNDEQEDVDVLRVLLRIKPMLRGVQYVDVENHKIAEDAHDGDGEYEEDNDVDWAAEDVEGRDEDMAWDEDDEDERDEEEEEDEEEESAADWGEEDVFEEDEDERYEDEWSSYSVAREEAEELRQPLLYWAAKRGYVDVVKLLLAAGAEMREKHTIESFDGSDNMNALHIASGCGHVEVVKVLLAAGATAIIAETGSVRRVVDYEDVRFKDMTALLFAVERGHIEVVRVLIAAGADVDAKDGSALYYAGRNGSVELVQMLLAAGANVHYKYSYLTPLHHACRDDNPALVEMLLAAGADVHAKNYLDNTPLHDVSRKDAVDAIKLLLAAGADVNAKNLDGVTPLHVAVCAGWAHVVEVLLAAGADVNVKNNDGYTMLHLAAISERACLMKPLVTAGADLTATDKYGRIALHAAIGWERQEVLKALLDPDAFCVNARVIGARNGQ